MVRLVGLVIIEISFLHALRNVRLFHTPVLDFVGRDDLGAGVTALVFLPRTVAVSAGFSFHLFVGNDYRFRLCRFRFLLIDRDSINFLRDVLTLGARTLKPTILSIFGIGAFRSVGG